MGNLVIWSASAIPGDDIQMLNYEIKSFWCRQKCNTDCSCHSVGLRHLMVDNPQFAGFGSRGMELQLLQITFVQRSFSVTGSALCSASWA